MANNQPHTTPMNTLYFDITVPKPTAFSLKVPDFDPRRDMGERHKFDGNVVYGIPDNDGISTFPDTLALSLSAFCSNEKEAAFEILFPTGLPVDRVSIKGDERLRSLAHRRHADPALGWALINEKNTRILRYLLNVFGVRHLEFLRRPIYNAYTNKHAFLCLHCPIHGPWRWYLNNFDNHRNRFNHAVSLVGPSL